MHHIIVGELGGIIEGAPGMARWFGKHGTEHQKRPTAISFCLPNNLDVFNVQSSGPVSTQEKVDLHICGNSDLTLQRRSGNRARPENPFTNV
jgi:hypothetical protein